MKKIKTRTQSQVYRLWLKNLRNGKYKQAQGSLRETNYGTSPVLGHCCLGVLQDLAVKDGGPEWNTRYGPEDLADRPSAEIVQFMGLSKCMLHRLVDLNDNLDYTFGEIADVIEFEIMPTLGIE